MFYFVDTNNGYFLKGDFEPVLNKLSDSSQESRLDLRALIPAEPLQLAVLCFDVFLRVGNVVQIRAERQRGFDHRGCFTF